MSLSEWTVIALIVLLILFFIGEWLHYDNEKIKAKVDKRVTPVEEDEQEDEDK